jgi:nucleotide-binding universal stress UspA family protein
MFTNILLAADNLERAQQAARMAGETARSQPASNLTIVVTYPAVPDYLGNRESERAIAERLAQAESLAASLRDEVGSIPGRVQTEFLEGSLAQVAATLSQTRGSDLIVLGVPHQGPWARIKTWFKAEPVLHGAPCPVLMV